MSAATDFVKLVYHRMTILIQTVSFYRYREVEYARHAKGGLIQTGGQKFQSTKRS